MKFIFLSFGCPVRLIKNPIDIDIRKNIVVIQYLNSKKTKVILTVPLSRIEAIAEREDPMPEDSEDLYI